MVVAVSPEQPVWDEAWRVDHVDHLVAVQTGRGREHHQLERTTGRAEELGEEGTSLQGVISNVMQCNVMQWNVL